MSSAPCWSASWAVCTPCMTQNTFTCGTLSKRRRETAKVFSASAPVAIVVRAWSLLRTLPSFMSTKSCW
ncbi:hypothetical protein SBADM41S_07801 [Streptomyces badius]